MSVNVRSTLVVNTSRPLQHMYIRNSQRMVKMATVLIWANMVHYNEGKVGMSLTWRQTGIAFLWSTSVSERKCVLLYRM